jgi:FlaA1/EpsC-like NDP-sugar epimerase
VPTCEYYPYQAVLTNISGPENIVRIIEEQHLSIDTVVGVSTDKACKPVNVMGMTKAIQERIFIQGNMRCPNTRFICVRYGNVLASRGSVIPLFHEQIRNGGPLTITSPDMTRFLLSLDQAVDTIFAAVRGGNRGETYIPRVPSARVVDIAKALIGPRKIAMDITGIRPGEKLHEILVSEEECLRTADRGVFYAIAPILPELRSAETEKAALTGEYSSENDLMRFEQIVDLLQKQKLMVEDTMFEEGEILR